MGKSDDWFRNDRWDAAEEKKFFSRLKRYKGSTKKALIARAKATLLEATCDPRRVRVAIDLLTRILKLWPLESDIALCRWQLARCFLILENVDAALKQFELALKREKEVPKYLTGAWSDFAQLVVTRKLREHYGDVRRLLQARDKFFIYPADRFVAHACLALIARENGLKSVARDEAEQALAEIERPHENKSLVRDFDRLIERLRKIAR
jgi:tetratricopeptide (TPR) repeat protein